MTPPPSRARPAGSIPLDRNGRPVKAKRKPVRPRTPPSVLSIIGAASDLADGFYVPLRIYGEKNLAEHFHTKGKWTAAYREIARALTSSRFPSMPPAFPLTVTITRVAPRMLDGGDNDARACSALRDGIADALGINDKDSRVSWRYEQQRGEPKQYAVRVEIAPRELCPHCKQVMS